MLNTGLTCSGNNSSLPLESRGATQSAEPSPAIAIQIEVMVITRRRWCLRKLLAASIFQEPKNPVDDISLLPRWTLIPQKRQQMASPNSSLSVSVGLLIIVIFIIIMIIVIIIITCSIKPQACLPTTSTTGRGTPPRNCSTPRTSRS